MGARLKIFSLTRYFAGSSGHQGGYSGGVALY
jgi:hypothetical protein